MCGNPDLRSPVINPLSKLSFHSTPSCLSVILAPDISENPSAHVGEELDTPGVLSL